MIKKDTVRLLRECDSGIKMGIQAINDVLPHVQDGRLRQCLRTNRHAHSALQAEIEAALSRFHDTGKKPALLAQKMSTMKTNLKFTMDASDRVAAELILDGCHMGTKSLEKYLHQYKAADEASKDIAKRLIHLEDQLTQDVRPFL